MIKVTKAVNADSRSAEKLTVPALRSDTVKHIKDVSAGLKFIADQINDRGKHHDHTKIEHMDDFYSALTSGKVKESEWYKTHITEERHHLKSNVPDDVNLIDVIEHLVDCTMAGLTRSGEIYDVDIPAETLVLAMNNTVELLKKNTTVVDEKGKETNSLLNQKIDEDNK